MSSSPTSGIKDGKKHSFDPDGWHVCPWCGSTTRVQQIHGHYECTRCHRSVWDCCSGETSSHHHDPSDK
jgi:hypothetical protein